MKGSAIDTAFGQIGVAGRLDGNGVHVQIVSQQQPPDQVFVTGSCENDATKSFLAFSLSRDGAEALAWLLRDALDRSAIVPAEPV